MTTTLKASDVQGPRQQRFVECMDRLELTPKAIGSSAHPNDDQAAKRLATKVSGIKGGTLVLSPKIAEEVAPVFDVEKECLLGQLTPREQSATERNGQPSLMNSAEMTPVAEREFRKNALEALLQKENVSARNLAEKIEPSDERAREACAMHLAEARVGDALLGFRCAKSIENLYGLPVKSLYTGLLQEEIDSLNDEERAELFPPKKSGHSARKLRKSRQ